MSLRSMSLSKVDSMVALSVLLSTTRKFFCESGPVVTCCLNVRYTLLPRCPEKLTPMPARSRPVTESWESVSGGKLEEQATLRTVPHHQSRQEIACPCSLLVTYCSVLSREGRLELRQACR